MQTGATFDAGGTFTVTGNGTNGIPNGILFSGMFFGPATWTHTQSNGMNSYTLTAVVSGMLGGIAVIGTTVQETVSTSDLFSGSDTIMTGTTSFTVPEPSPLALLATGSLGLLRMIRRKLPVR